jgi:hypothetical protein
VHRLNYFLITLGLNFARIWATVVCDRKNVEPVGQQKTCPNACHPERPGPCRILQNSKKPRTGVDGCKHTNMDRKIHAIIQTPILRITAIRFTGPARGHRINLKIDLTRCATNYFALESPPSLTRAKLNVKKLRWKKMGSIEEFIIAVFCCVDGRLKRGFYTESTARPFGMGAAL